MKVIIPIAGRGTRVRPHTYSKCKPFLPIAGKIAIDFVLQPILALKPESIIIVHDVSTEKEVKELLPKRFPNTTFEFALQEKPLGTGHAVYQAKHLVKPGNEILIVYSDMIFSKDLSCINELKANSDGILFAKEVPDPQHYGVLNIVDGYVTEILEKVSNPPSNLANMGIYYLKDGHIFLTKHLQKVIDQGKNERGEYFLTDAFSYLAKDEGKLLAEPIGKLLDTGTVKKLVEAHKTILAGGIVLGKDVKLERTEIGENVSIGDNSVLINCKIKNSIIGDNCILEGMSLNDSMIGDNVTLKENGAIYNVGDNCKIL